MDEAIAEAGDRHGDCCKEKAQIRLFLDERASEDLTTHTFFHELVHALLYATTKPELSSDEEFVDSLGAVLHQYEQTKKGSLRG
jgi:hypothetical protein